MSRWSGMGCAVPLVHLKKRSPLVGARGQKPKKETRKNGAAWVWYKCMSHGPIKTSCRSIELSCHTIQPPSSQMNKKPAPIAAVWQLDYHWNRMTHSIMGSLLCPSVCLAFCDIKSLCMCAWGFIKEQSLLVFITTTATITYFADASQKLRWA